MSLYYQSSNKMPLGGILLSLVGGGVAAAVLALTYVYAVWYIPFIYINFFICVGFGLLLGVALLLLAKRGKLRSVKGVAALALLVAVAAVYLEWAVYLTLQFNTDTISADVAADASTSFTMGTFSSIFFHPETMWQAMTELNKTGTWTLKGSTPSGIFLWLIWAVEAFVVVGGACFMASSQAGEPFSEMANEWAESEVLAHPVGYAHDEAATRTALEMGQFQTLTPHLTEADEEQFARLTLYHVPNDPNCQHLTLENVTKTLDKKGKASNSTSTVVERLAISLGTHQALKARFGTAPVKSSAG